MKSVCGLVAVLSVVLGCVSRGDFDQLPRADQQRFQRCSKPMEPAMCGEITSEMYRVQCIRGGQASYAENKTPRERMEWLVGNGCPASMVQPKAHLAAEDGQ